MNFSNTKGDIAQVNRKYQASQMISDEFFPTKCGNSPSRQLEAKTTQFCLVNHTTYQVRYIPGDMWDKSGESTEVIGFFSPM